MASHSISKTNNTTHCHDPLDLHIETTQRTEDPISNFNDILTTTVPNEQRSIHESTIDPSTSQLEVNSIPIPSQSHNESTSERNPAHIASVWTDELGNEFVVLNGILQKLCHNAHSIY
eukprot:466866_1